MKTTVKQIFESLQFLNPKTNTMSSIGSYVSPQNRELSYNFRNEIMEFLLKESLAYKIITSTQEFFTDKQKWVIAYELERNAEYCKLIEEKEIKEKKAISYKELQSKTKLAANKSNAQPILDFIKKSGKKLGDYYIFVKNSKEFKKEFYSKKYTQNSAEAFLAI